MRMFKARALANAGALLLSLGMSCAAAQGLPQPAEFYFDRDESVARPIVAIAGSDDATAALLLRQMERGGRNADFAAAQLAHLALASGRRDTGLALYARAVGMASDGSARQRSILWNQGWDLYRLGDVDAALSTWARAFPSRIVYPDWVPPTLALALWRLDRREEAVAWYAAAVRTWPDRWSDASALAGLLPDWSEADRARLAEVLAAWREAPPRWP